MQYILRTSLVCALLLLAGCGGSGDFAEVADLPDTGPYTLDSGDRLRVIVFGQEDLSGTFAVDGSGFVSLPLIKPVMARGLTTDELEERIEEVLSETLLRNPNVTAEIEAFRPFFILGEVQQPGQYPFVSGMTVQTAAAIAGGYTYRAVTSSAVITRKSGGRIVEAKVPATTAVRPGDTVLIQERYF